MLPIRLDLELLGVLGKRVGSVVHRLPRLLDLERVEDDLSVVPLALTEDGNPPKEWLLEHGRTRRCNACERGLFHGVKHSVGCRKRYCAWLDEQRANSPALPSQEDDHSPTEEVVPEPFGIDDGLPEISVEKPNDLVEVEVGDLGVPRVEDYLPDGVEREGFDPLAPHADGCEPLSPANPEGESPDPAAGIGYDEDMEVDASLLEPTFESLEALPLVVIEDFADRLRFKASVFSSVDDNGWTSLKMRDRVIYLQKPSFVRDDTTNASLSVDKANDEMKKEIRALDALRVGDAITKAEADAYCKEHGVRVLSTRWVSVAKKDGETKEDIVRARVVARDYAAGGPTAAELGISSPTSSNEAFRTFLVFVSAAGSDVVLADVSTDCLLVRVDCLPRVCDDATQREVLFKGLP